VCNTYKHRTSGITVKRASASSRSGFAVAGVASATRRGVCLPWLRPAPLEATPVEGLLRALGVRQRHSVQVLASAATLLCAADTPLGCVDGGVRRHGLAGRPPSGLCRRLRSGL
jgi:hypothetical protein